MRRLGILLTFLVACDSSGSNQGGVDSGALFDAPDLTDTAVDTAVDSAVGTDTAIDSTVDTGTDATPDSDTGTDATIDTTPDSDTSTDATIDTTPDADTTTDSTVDSDTSTTAAIGDGCETDGDCGAGGVCLALPGGYCSVGDCDVDGCPDGASCWTFTDAGSYCLKDCTASAECRGDEGYVCDGDDTCWTQSEEPSGESPIGGACALDADCKDAGAFCYPADIDGEATGFFAGYCMIADCTEGSCPAGSTCQAIFQNGGTACVESCDGGADGCNQGYGCFQPGVCFPSCADSGCPANFACDAASDTCLPSCSADSCPDGTVCRADGTCGAPPCTANSCGAGYLCAANGECVPDLDGGPGAGPGPACANVPARDCTANCGDIVAFEPDTGPGYWDYPINGETQQDEYRSFARRDLMMLIKWATAMVDCKAAAWAGGNGEPLGLGDMSEANGAIPGTRDGEPGHPEGTHENGYDMDIAYFQTAASPDNTLRPVCPHTEGGAEAYHCTGTPNLLDVWRDALFLGFLLQSPRTRVIGVDGKVGPLVEQAMDVLCADGWLSGTPCTANRALAYETTDQGLGWFYFHLHHQHISLKQVAQGAPTLPGADRCLVPGCGPMESSRVWGDGLARPTTLEQRPRVRVGPR